MRRAILAAMVATACSGNSEIRRWGVGDQQASVSRPLSSVEQQLVDTNGFAILERAWTQSFFAGYTELFREHQPVYVTADSILYAWHSSYDAILQDVEHEHMIPTLRAMLVELRRRLPTGQADARTRADVDVYLAVAQALLDGTPAPPVAGGDAAAIRQAVADATAAASTELALFGAPRDVDFSMFVPRGHYAVLPELQQYFRAMTWLGRIEIEIARQGDGEGAWKVNRRALRGTVLLSSLFEGTPRALWSLLDGSLGELVGPPDSMAMEGLAKAVAALGSDLDAPDAEVVAALRGAARQRIRTQLIHHGAASLGFLLLGQRYVVDGDIVSGLVWDAIDTDPKRLMPTPLDVAHAVFGNPAADALLSDERARFGAAYDSALRRARDTIERTAPDVWEGSAHHAWLHAIAALSPDPARDAAMPAPLRSDAWARRMMATQLASWAELRHDDLLYAKQSVTVEVSCEYPDAYVEPYPQFFARMRVLASRGKAMVARLTGPRLEEIEAYFDQMAAAMDRLGAIAERERAHEPLLPQDLDFINHMVSLDGRSGGCGGPSVEPHGWYADLYYDRSRILRHEPVIADIHTQPEDPFGLRVGRVLHVGTRDPRMLVARIEHDRGRHAQTYRGFVSSYAEVITTGFRRYTDEEWRSERPPVDSIPAWLASIVAGRPSR